MIHRKESILLVIGITLVILFVNLGAIPLLDPDEPVYAETAKEMIAYSDYLSPRIYGSYWFDKPPMYYWLVAGSFQMFGISEFSSRLPSALLGLGCVLLVYWFARKEFGPRAGLSSALVLATSLEYYYLGKAAVTDMTLCFCLTASILSYARKQYYWFYLFAGLATVTKGPVGFAFPAAIIGLHMLLNGRLRELLHMKLPAGILIYAASAMPWYVLMYQKHGWAFLDTFIGFHNITRFTSPEHPEGVLWYFFIPVLVLGFFPWTAIFVQSCWQSLTASFGQQRQHLLLCNIWAVFIFLFFSVSQTKLVSYILPMYPPLALIAGWYIATLQERRDKKRLIAWPLIITGLCLLLGAGMVYGLEQMPSLRTGVFLQLAVLAVMAAGSWYYAWNKRPSGIFWTQTLGAMCFAIVLVTAMFPAVAADFTAKEVAASFVAQYDGKSPVYTIKFLHPGFSFYSGVYGREAKDDKELSSAISTEDRCYLVIRKGDYEDLTEQDRSRLTVLFQNKEQFLLLKK